MSYQFLKENQVKIRKKRRCEGCEEIHTPPFSMLKIDGVYDGQMQHAYLCGACVYFLEHSKSTHGAEPENFYPFNEYVDYQELRQKFLNSNL